MKIHVLGCGSAFTLNNYQTSFLIKEGKSSLLFDCGGDIRFALRDMNMTYKDVENIFITHLHGDHTGGLEWLGFSKYFDSTPKPSLFVSESLVDDLWNKSLKGGMGVINERVAKLEDFFSVRSLSRMGEFSIGNTKTICSPIKVNHISNGFYDIPSFGLMIETKNEKKVFLTGDTKFDFHNLEYCYNYADIIIQDCEYLYKENGNPIKSGVHSHYEDLKSLPEKIKKKMWLTHYQDNMPLEIGFSGEFAGMLYRGQVLDI